MEVDPRSRLHGDQLQEGISKMERSILEQRIHRHGKETPKEAMEIGWRESQDKKLVETLDWITVQLKTDRGGTIHNLHTRFVT